MADSLMAAESAGPKILSSGSAFLSSEQSTAGRGILSRWLAERGRPVEVDADGAEGGLARRIVVRGGGSDGRGTSSGCCDKTLRIDFGRYKNGF